MKKSKKNLLFSGALLIVFAMLFSIFAGCFIGISFEHVAEAVSTVDAYYQGLNEELTGTAFRSVLANLITTTHTRDVSYAGLKDAYKTADADPNKSGNIIWFYTGTSVSFSGFGSGTGSTNREHVWPKDAGNAFPAESKAGSDAHHVRPVEQQLNSTRNNNSFGEVAKTANNVVKQANSTTYGVGDGLCYLSGDFFYPAEGYRGATARILMYVQVRWGNDYNLRFVDSAGNCKTIGKISTLLKWHLQEPPTDEEIRRNEAVYGIQGNRNPFIDHPEYATKIFCYDGESYNNSLLSVVNQYGDYKDEDVESISFDQDELTLSVGQSAKINATVLPITASKDLTWTSSVKSVATVDKNGVVTAVSGGWTTIIAQSVKTPTVKATLQVHVLTTQSISISGKPSQTVYCTGDAFNSAGLTVTATYDDGSTGIVANANCEWLDANTGQATLSKGTTAVICKVGEAQATYSGIVVKSIETSEITITRENFTGSGVYAWTPWTSGGISGYGYMYPGATQKIQMNKSKPSYYIYNTTPIPGKILSITIVLDQGANEWEILTSSTPYTQVTGVPKTGNSYGIKKVDTEGTTWIINNNDSYFAICYAADKGATYVKSITIRYGDEEECDHNYGAWVDGSPASCEHAGVAGHYQCTECGAYFDADHNEINTIVIPALEHTESDWIVTPATCTRAGEQHTVCTVCGKTIKTQYIPKTAHTPGDWIVDVPAVCGHDGSQHTECVVCGETVIIQPIPAPAHQEGEWIVDREPTCAQAGEKHTVCEICGETVQTQAIPALEHVESDWIIDVEPTCAHAGSKHTVCVICGQTISTEILPVLEHNYGEWTLIQQPSDQSEGLEVRECTVCHSAREERVPFSQEKEDFITSVAALANANGLQAQFDAIKASLEKYNVLTTAQKNAVASQYQTLTSAINTYNATVAVHNEEHQNASQVAILAVAGAFVALSALLYLLSMIRPL